ncbi:hypothetical protein [Phenylobacterium sp.]|uniref:hypothetical protein n=1 Tax=Phenylobacterium sp. TaxID=1871053 RepID=UPI00273798A3|nr:hypothetical protein [Phenylobacterium sp.]MDP3869127.1 hypothetical protein [Phenylobacterium sp.]
MTESLQSCPNLWCGGVGPMPFALRDHKWAVICGCDFHGPTRDDREAAITAWNTRAPRSEGLAAPKGIDRSELVERELKRCHEVIGAYVIAQAYADTLPDDAEDAADMTFGQHYWEGAASHWAGEDLLSRAHEAAKARMRVENPVQVRDLDWSAAMGDVVASGGLPQDKDEDEDPVCTGCGGSGITYQTERPCACIPTALSAPSPSADALRPGLVERLRRRQYARTADATEQLLFDAASEIERLEALLDGRDGFIVHAGLWEAFSDSVSLPPAGGRE